VMLCGWGVKAGML